MPWHQTLPEGLILLVGCEMFLIQDISFASLGQSIIDSYWIARPGLGLSLDPECHLNFSVFNNILTT